MPESDSILLALLLATLDEINGTEDEGGLEGRLRNWRPGVRGCMTEPEAIGRINRLIADAAHRYQLPTREFSKTSLQRWTKVIYKIDRQAA